MHFMKHWGGRGIRPTKLRLEVAWKYK